MIGPTLPLRCPLALANRFETFRQRPANSTHLKRNTATRRAPTLIYNSTSSKSVTPTTPTTPRTTNTATTRCPACAATYRPFHSPSPLLPRTPSRLPLSPHPSPSSPPTTYSNTPAAFGRPAGPPGAAVQLPFSSETARAVHAVKEQSARQGLMFAGPDQLLLGILATVKQPQNRAEGGIVRRGAGGGGDVDAVSAAALLEAALGGGDVDSVREWINEQTGVTAPIMYGGGGGGGGGLLPSDVDFSPAARRVLALAGEGAAEMGSRSVGTYHLLMVLMMPSLPTATATTATTQEDSGAPLAPEHPAGDAPPPTQQPLEAAAAANGSQEQQQQQQAASELSPNGPRGGRGGSGSGGSSSGGDNSSGGLSSRRGPAGGGGGMLPALLRVAGVDVNALYGKLLTLAERDAESPPRMTAEDAYEGVVSHLRTTYQQQQQLIQQRSGVGARREEVEAALRRWPPRPESLTDEYGSQQAQPYPQDDVCE